MGQRSPKTREAKALLRDDEKKISGSKGRHGDGQKNKKQSPSVPTESSTSPKLTSFVERFFGPRSAPESHQSHSQTDSGFSPPKEPANTQPPELVAGSYPFHPGYHLYDSSTISSSLPLHHHMDFNPQEHAHANYPIRSLSQQQHYINPSPTSALSGLIDTGMESDDLLTYSDDDTHANSITQTRLPIKPSEHLYPSYPSQEHMHSHESHQLMEAQKMMAMGPRYSERASYGSFQNGDPFNERYSSSPHGMQNRSDEHRGYQVTAIGPKGQIAHPDMDNTVTNEMYFSEDGSVTTHNSGSTVSQYDRFFFNRHESSRSKGHRKMPSAITEEEIPNVFAEADEEEKELNGSKGSSDSVPNDRVKLISEVESNDSETSKSKSSRSSTNPITLPTPSTTRSNHSRGSSKGGYLQTGKMVPILPKQPMLDKSPSFPPPPISSVNIITANASITTIDTGGSSNTSQNHGTPRSNPQLPHYMRGLTRKEIKRVRRKIRAAEEMEEQVQMILRSGHTDALDWSRHVPQQVGGINRAAGFFPDEESLAHDKLFAVLFILQLGVVAYVAICFAGLTTMTRKTTDGGGSLLSMAEDYDNPFSTTTTTIATDSTSPIAIWAKDIYVDYTDAFHLACITALYASSISALAVGMMMILSRALIQTCLYLTIILSFAFFSIGVALNSYNVIPLLGLVSLILSTGYCALVWERIPFATTNLNIAMYGMKSSADVLLVGFGMMAVSFFWTMFWAVAFLGVYDHYLAKSINTVNITWEALASFLGMFISYGWTLNVIRVRTTFLILSIHFSFNLPDLLSFCLTPKNIVHVTVSGVIGTWWSSPDDLDTCCNDVLREQFVKSITQSFGSICAGSLLVPPVQFMQSLFSLLASPFHAICGHPTPTVKFGFDETSEVATSKRGDSSVTTDNSPLGGASSGLNFCDEMGSYWNEFGFTYIGIYREDFKSSSKKATDVFLARDWYWIASDRLIPTVLGIANFIIALNTGVFGLVIEEFDGYNFTNYQKPTSTAFL